MISIISRNIVRFISLIIFQILILNNINFSGFVNPYLYILFVLLLPFETPKWFLIISAFLLGLSIDIFSDSLGMHASATVLVAFFRPYVLNLIAPRDGYEPGTFPRVFYYGFFWFVKYSALLIVVHHFFFFVIEAFNFQDFNITIIKVFFSSVFTLIVVILSQFLIFRK